ncbi:MAG: Fur family transcriptional regulator [Eubacteriales bacterium]|nr:Fur family transcriptional regulator [Eubacteriales bacterium]
MDFYKQVIRNNDLKVTRQRLSVLEILAENKGEHLKAEEVFQRIKCRHPEYGIATVYRTLQTLFEIGLVDRLRLDDGVARYELLPPTANANPKRVRQRQHHHLICTVCNNVLSFTDDILADKKAELEAQYGCKITDYELKIYGSCAQCAKPESEEQHSE